MAVNLMSSKSPRRPQRVARAFAARWAGSSGVGAELVAQAPDGLDQARRGGVRLDLHPQAADVHVYLANVAALRVAPGMGDQDLAGQDLAGVAHQAIEQLALGRCQ